MAFFYGEE